MISVSCLKVVGYFFHSTCNGIERSSPSQHTINLVYIYIYIYRYEDTDEIPGFFLLLKNHYPHCAQ